MPKRKFWLKEGNMYRGVPIALPVLFFAWNLSSPCPSPLADPASLQLQQKSTAKTNPKSPAAALKGCVDEQEGHYVLMSAETLVVLANLEADGFPMEGFAKHLGHKVIVRGTSIPNGNHPVFKVRSVETVSDTCAPG
jgi:hypothetical protein